MKKILIVDDAAFMRQAIKGIFIKNSLIDDIDIVEATDGADAIRKYQQIKPDIVTMDITMPDMTGIEALKQILESDPKAKVVMISAIGQESVVREAIMVGAKTFIIKPFKEDCVINAINKLLAV